MQKTYIMRFVNSLVLVPLVTFSVPQGLSPKSDITVEPSSQIAFSTKLNINPLGLNFGKTEEDQAEKELELKASAIDTYFADRSLPLEGYGRKMVIEAEKNGLDWRLIPAIAMRESTGGKFACKSVKFNAFGWGSCKIGFKSYEDAIEKLAQHLGGNHPNTDQYYADKSTLEILRTYNPPSVVPKYAEQVMKIMSAIGNENVI